MRLKANMVLAFFIFGVFLSSSIQAENSDLNQDAIQAAKEAGAKSYGGSMGAAGPYLSKDFIPTDNAVPTLGREYALEAVARDYQKGANVNGVTGGLLLGAATGYFLMGDFITGSALTSMAVKEFAQGNQNNQAAKTTDGQRIVLTNDWRAGVGSSTPVSGKKDSALPIYQPEIPKNFEDYLTRKGINIDDFKKSLFEGQMDDSIDSILASLGDGSNSYSMEDLDKAKSKAQQEYAKLSSEAVSKVNENSPNGGLGAPGSGAQASSGDSSKDSALEKRDPASNHSGQSKASGPSGSTQGAGPSENSASFMNQFASSGPMTEQGLMFENFLKNQGLVPSRAGSNIFLIAQQNYRAFSKWRVKDSGKKNQVGSQN